MEKTRGFVYRTFRKYDSYLLKSITSLRANGGVCKDYPVTVFDFNRYEESEEIKNLREIGVEIIKVKYEGRYKSRVDREHRFEGFSKMCYDTEVRIDADTLILKDPVELFEAAEKNLFVGILDHWKPNRLSIHGEKIKQINGGVLAYSREGGEKIWEEYKRQRKIKETPLASDQPILNTILDRLDLHKPENIIDKNYNRPSMKEGTKIFHYYSFAKQNKKLMRMRDDKHMEDLNRLDLINKLRGKDRILISLPSKNLFIKNSRKYSEFYILEGDKEAIKLKKIIPNKREGEDSVKSAEDFVYFLERKFSNCFKIVDLCIGDDQGVSFLRDILDTRFHLYLNKVIVDPAYKPKAATHNELLLLAFRKNISIDIQSSL